MRTRRRIFSICIVLLFMLADASVLPFTGINMLYAPKLALAAAITIALVMGRTQGMIYGAFAGIITDITVSVPIGLTTGLYTMCALASGFLGRKMRSHLMSTVLAALLGFIMYELAMFVYFTLSYSAFDWQRLKYAFLRCIIGTLLVQILYIPFNAILKPRRSRYSETRL